MSLDAYVLKSRRVHDEIGSGVCLNCAGQGRSSSHPGGFWGARVEFQSQHARSGYWCRRYQETLPGPRLVTWFAQKLGSVAATTPPAKYSTSGSPAVDTLGTGDFTTEWIRILVAAI